MRFLYIVAGLLSLALLGNCISARKDPGDSLQDVSNTQSDCHQTSAQPKSKQFFVSDFEPRPSATAYVEGFNPKDKSFVGDFEPRPSATAYVNAFNPKDKSFMSDFEPRPSATSYVNALNPKDKFFVSDFEPRPSATTYVDDAKPEEDKREA